MSALYLAVDGGDTKTDVVLGTSDGEVLGFVRGAASTPRAVGVPGAMEVLDTLIRAARAGAGVPPSIPIDLVGVFLAGVDLPVEVDRLHTAIARMGWARECVVDNDTFALLRAGTAMPDAIAVGCGAGITCVGRTADGRTARLPALGEISGDWGGGHHLAERTLWYAARGEDGRGTPTALSAAVAQHLGRPTVESVSIGLHLGDIPHSAVHTLTPVLFQVAATGDPVAERLVQRQVHEIRALHRVVAERLGIRHERHTLVLGGGVLRARQPLLHEPLVAGVEALSPQVVVTVLNQATVVGAALLTLDALASGVFTGGTRTAGSRAIDPGIEQILRTELQRDPAQAPDPDRAPGPDRASAPAAASAWTDEPAPDHVLPAPVLAPDPFLAPDPILDAPSPLDPGRRIGESVPARDDHAADGRRSPGQTTADLGPVGPLW